MAPQQVQFTILDYFFFTIVFLLCIAIGLYYALKKKTGSSIEEYLFGGKKFSVLPVSFSVAATTISGSSIIGQSMEVYAYGVHNWITLVIGLMTTTIMQCIFLPVFYELQLTSTFTYLEMRFDRSVKLLASAMFVITGIIVIPLTIYVPALAFQEVTGINLYLIAVATGAVCIWYTAIGGIKAVIWTDVMQMTLIICSGITIMIVGLNSTGGVVNVWEALHRGGRLTALKLEFDIEARGTIWSYFFSILFIFLYQFCVSQNNVQRYLSVSSIRKAKTTLWIQNILSSFVIIIQFIIGGIIYTTYEECDPLMAGVVKKIDQIFPHFVQEKASLFTGFNGIFIAGVFAAGLSTTSTLLNTISGTIYSDFLGPRLRNPSGRAFSWIIRLIVAAVGVLGIILLFLIERMGTIYAITVQCFTLTTVGVFGLFTSGMLIPTVNSKGVKCGVIVGILAVGILMFGGLNKRPDPPLPLRTDGCDFLESFVPRNTTSIPLKRNEDIPWIFRINFQYYCFVGLFLNISVEYLVSVLTGGNVVEDQRLLVTYLRKEVPQEPLITKKSIETDSV